MSQPLAVRYRPVSFDQMVGQKLSATVLSQMVAMQMVPSGLLFAGPSGTGKTTAARILATGLSPDVDPALSVVEVDAASHGGVADVRALTETLRYSTGSTWRVVIIDEAHSLTRDAFNALLKTLEEPPQGVVFVLVTTEPHKIPETVKSRLMEFEFRRVSAAEIFDRLVVICAVEQITVSEPLLAHLAQSADGSVRRAVMDLEKASVAGLTTLEAWQAQAGVVDASAALLHALASGDTAGAYLLVEKALSGLGHPHVLTEQITSALRDLLVLRAGGTVRATGQNLDILHTLAARLEVERVLAAIKIVWDLKTRIRPTDDPRGSLDLAVALLGEVFTRGRTVQPVPSPRPEPIAHVEPTPAPEPAPSAEPRRLSLADLHR